jgi:hypothetical protein
MSQVGFPGFMDMRRRTIRGPVNPLDKSTVISIFPKEIVEYKHTIQPGKFEIHSGTYDKPAILVVGPSSWWRDIDIDQPLLEIPVSSIQIADSIVKDYCNGYLGCNMGDCMPGLFYMPGEITLEQIRTEHKKKLDTAQTKQKNWFSLLVKMADALWARSAGNPLAISDDMRLAARELNLSSNKDWMKDFTMVSMVRCKACGALKNPEFPICATCRFPDPAHPMTKQLLEMAEKLPKAQ